ncbi:MAG TPA: D-alanyl-D-alanine carboxypeptidase family protein [Pantanalinema sp.]
MVRKIHLAALLIPLLATIAAVPAQAAGTPSVSAKAAIVIDGVTGQVLYAKNVHDRLPQASTTKMMAGIVALERGSLADEIQVSKRAAETEGSSMYLEAGERLTFEQLLYGMMLNSGNDATEAVAEYISGDADHFVGLMNQKAQALGLKDTRYVTPHGLPAKEHYSSAYDLAQIARYALSNPAFAEIAATKAFPLPGNKRAPHRMLVNHNKLLRYFPGAWGGKTGYTIVAGKCFVGSAKRDGRYVIEALLSAPDCWADAEKLLNYGLDSFTSEPVAAAGQAMADAKVAGGARGSVKAVLAQAVALSVPKGGKKPEVSPSIRLSPSLKAPVKAGQPVGTYELRQGDRLLASTPLVAAADVPVGGLELGDLGAVFGWFLKGGALSVALFSAFRWRGMRRRGRRKRGKGLLGASNAIHR